MATTTGYINTSSILSYVGNVLKVFSTPTEPVQTKFHWHIPFSKFTFLSNIGS